MPARLEKTAYDCVSKAQAADELDAGGGGGFRGAGGARQKRVQLEKLGPNLLREPETCRSRGIQPSKRQPGGRVYTPGGTLVVPAAHLATS